MKYNTIHKRMEIFVNRIRNSILCIQRTPHKNRINIYISFVSIVEMNCVISRPYQYVN